jgi:Fe-S-cluster-containing hydrogenase component 2
LALAEVLPGDVPPATPAQNAHKPTLCLGCAGQPCLQACPVHAYTGTTFELNACAVHLKTLQGQACMQMGCMARRACPVGQQHTYVPEHASFHMNAFISCR